MKVNIACSEVGLKRESESEPDVDNIPFRLNNCTRVRVLAELSEALPVNKEILYSVTERQNLLLLGAPSSSCR